MAYFYLDGGLSTGANDGSSFDDAFQDFKTAMEYNSYSPGDFLVVRRRSNFSGFSSNVVPHVDSDGKLNSWIRVIGWPRDQVDLYGDFTYGSNLVTNITSDGSTPFPVVWTHHAGRMMRNTGKEHYLITDVDEGNDHLILDRPYVGATVTGKGFRILKDHFYNGAQNVDDSGWTIKKSNWNNDTKRPPIVNFGGSSYAIEMGGNTMWEFINMYMGNGGNSFMRIEDVNHIAFKQCLIDQYQNAPAILFESHISNMLITQSILRGDGAGGNQVGIAGYGGKIKIVDSTIYNMGNDGLPITKTAEVILENVNVGVEAENGGYDVALGPLSLNWKDVILGSTDKIERFQWLNGEINIENYGKEYLNDISFYLNGQAESLSVSQYSGTPKKRPNGSDRIIKVVGNIHTQARSTGFKETTFQLFEKRFIVDAGTISMRFYVQAEGMSLNANELFITAEYVKDLNNNNQFIKDIVQSDNAIAERSNDEDWSQFISIDDLEIAERSVLTIRCFFGGYSATGVVYVDTKED